MKTIASRLKQARLKRGWSVYELARRAELPAPTIHRIEDGESDPRLGTLRKLATALGVAVSELVD